MAGRWRVWHHAFVENSSTYISKRENSGGGGLLISGKSSIIRGNLLARIKNISSTARFAFSRKCSSSSDYKNLRSLAIERTSPAYRLLAYGVLELLRGMWKESVSLSTCYFYFVLKCCHVCKEESAFLSQYVTCAFLCFSRIVSISRECRVIVRTDVSPLTFSTWYCHASVRRYSASYYSKSYRLRRWIIRLVICDIRPCHAHYTLTMLELWMRRIHESGTQTSWRTHVCEPFVSKLA